MATHSSVLAWRIPGMAEPGGLSMGSHRVGHDWSDLAAAAALVNPGASVGKESICNAEVSGAKGSIPGSGRSPGGGHGNPLQYPCLENPMNRGAWRATVHGVAKGQTRLKWLSTHAHGYLFTREIFYQCLKYDRKSPQNYSRLCCRKSSWVYPCDWWII